MPADDAPLPVLGNPTPLALAGFSTAVFLVNSHSVGFVPGVDFVSSAALVSGVSLLTGCVYHFFTGNSLLLANFGIYGAMWLSFGIHMLKNPTADFDNIVALIRIPILAYSTQALVASAYGSKAAFSLFLSLVISLLLEIIGQLQGGVGSPGTHLMMQVGGGFGVWCALSGFYMSWCILLHPYVGIPLGTALLKIRPKPHGDDHPTHAPHPMVRHKKIHGSCSSFGSSVNLLHKLRRSLRRHPHGDPEQGVHPQGPPDASHGAPPKAPLVAPLAVAAAPGPPPRADSRALGLSGFACIVVMYSAHYIGWVQRIDWISPLAMIAAIVLLLSMIFHLNTGSTIHATNCGYYGAFWLAVSLNFLAQAGTEGVDPITGMLTAPTDDNQPQGSATFTPDLYGDLDGPLTWVRVTCAIYTAYAISASLFVCRAYALIYALFECQLLLLIIGHLRGQPGVMQAAGWFGFLCGILAFYMAASLYLRPFLEMPFWHTLSVPVLVPHLDEKGHALPLTTWFGKQRDACTTSSMCDLKAVLKGSGSFHEQAEAARADCRGSQVEVEMADHPHPQTPHDSHEDDDAERGPMVRRAMLRGLPDRSCPAPRKPGSSNGATGGIRSAFQAASYGDAGVDRYCPVRKVGGGGEQYNSGTNGTAGDTHASPLTSWSATFNQALERPFQATSNYGGSGPGVAGVVPRIALAQQAHHASIDLESAFRLPNSSGEGREGVWDVGEGDPEGVPAARAYAAAGAAATLHHAATATAVGGRWE